MTMGERSTASKKPPNDPSAKSYQASNIQMNLEEELSETGSKSRLKTEYTFASSPRALYNNKKMTRGSSHSNQAKAFVDFVLRKGNYPNQ
ncbi:hypothetical protein HUJ05_005280 [Dendroctonus ponderosae]|nr:hypothetical protein HUJ05_005280 [Dendroctonus ponderosae]